MLTAPLRLVLLVVGLAVVMAGCASKPIPFDRSMAPAIKTIGVITPKFPDGPNVVLATSVGQSFGLIGALVDAGMQANRDGRFRAIVGNEKYVAPDSFMESLTASLRSAGFDVVPVAMPREGTSFLAKYPTGAEPKVDAYLDIVAVSYGYVAAGVGSSAPFRPYFSMKTQLVSAKDGAVLMQDSVVFNPVGPVGVTGIEAMTIPPQPQPSYATFSALEGDPKGAVDGLKIAVAQSAEAVSKLLR